jgi:hypothetical protein
MRLVQTCSNCEPSKDPKSGCFNVCYQFTLHIQHCSSCTSHRVHGGIEVPRNPQKYAGGSRHLKEATRGFKWRYPIAGWFISWKIPTKKWISSNIWMVDFIEDHKWDDLCFILENPSLVGG